MFQAIVLAGGQGKRMGSTLPKVLHKVGDKTMLEKIVEKVLSYGAYKVYVVSGNNSILFKNVLFKLILSYEGKAEIVFVEQIPPQGTGHAVQCCLPYLENSNQVLILNGDTPLIDTCISEMILSATPTLLVTELDNPKSYGRVIVDKNGYFSKIIEEKDADEETRNVNLVNCGVYWLDTAELFNLVPKLKNNNAQNEYYLTDICEMMIEPLHLLKVPKEKQFELINVNTQEDLKKVNELICL